MLVRQHTKFSLPSGITYLNCAYMSPLMKQVEQAGVAGLKAKRNPTLIFPRDFFLQSALLRKEFAKLIRAQDAQRVAIVPSVSYGLANVAHNIRLHPSDKVIVLAEQFPSNYYPWQRLCQDSHARLVVVSPGQSAHRGKTWNEKILEAIDNQTRVVALGHVHWADGTLFDLKAIRKHTTAVGALLVIDGTQSVGALPFDVADIQPDALVCGGYKWLMGPYAIGLAYYGPYFDEGKPVEENWINRLNSEDFTGLVNYETHYQPGALRYDVGERSNFILVPMMLAALKQINEWKPKAIQAYCHSITRKGISLLRSNGFWIEEDAYRARHLFGIRPPTGIEMKAMRANLKKNHIAVSFRGDAIRVSPHLYNQERDILKLATALLSP